MRAVTKSLTVALGITLFGVSGYLLYLMFKRDDEEDDYDNSFARASKFKTLEIKVPKDLVRALIGRNGQNIKQIQEQSNTRINFKDREGSEARICVIRGSVEACNIADNLIQEFIDNQPVFECEDIWVPRHVIGKIIGLCGERITEIRTLSGAQIRVCDDEKENTKKRLRIKGTKEQINVAKSLIEDIVEKAQNSQAHIESTLAKREPRLPPKSPEILKQIDSPKIERISPILGKDGQFEVYVSALVDPSRFWLQIVGPKATQLDILVDEMTDFYSEQANRDAHCLSSVSKGDLVAAVFQYDNKWYRAEVLNVTKEEDGEQAELYYVDYGDTGIVPVNEIYELRTDFLKLHFQAIECFLAKVDPVGEVWSPDAVDKFEEWTHVAQWTKLTAKINGYSARERTRAKREGSPVPGVELYDLNKEQDIDIAQELVNHGFAVFKKDADLRLSSRATSISNVSEASSS